jgi:hypothetical protein
MPLDPKRVQAVFGAPVECDANGDRATVLDPECSTDRELRQRVEALLRAHDGFNVVNQPIIRPGDQVSTTPSESSLEPSDLTGFVFPDSGPNWSPVRASTRGATWSTFQASSGSKVGERSAGRGPPRRLSSLNSTTAPPVAARRNLPTRPPSPT